MIIKANTPALTALYAPEKQKETEGIFKKLATGQISSLFKIDEAPVINETMKVKMRELDLNARYAQEAVAVAQTAQEGLGKIQTKLEDMQKLVAMASEDIYTDEDRQKIQREINGLNKGIDDIVKNTTYKGQNILDRDNEPKVDEAAEGAEAAASAGEKDIVKEILDKFEKEFGMKKFTAEALGTDKVDVSSAEAAKNSMKIVEQAIKTVKDAMKDWKLFEGKHTNYFELDAPEDAASPTNRPSMAIGALELVKYNLLNTNARILLDNSSQDPDRVTSLLK